MICQETRSFLILCDCRVSHQWTDRHSSPPALKMLSMDFTALSEDANPSRMFITVKVGDATGTNSRIEYAIDKHQHPTDFICVYYVGDCGMA